MASKGSPDQLMRAVADSMAARTGRTLEGWVRAVQESGVDPLDQNAVRRWLDTEHGLLQNTRWAIADAAATAAGWVRPTRQEYADAQYTGAKAALRPIFDRLAAQLMALGPDVQVEGRSTYVPFVRGRQFAAIAASTRRRVDLGLRFTDPPSSTRLAPAKGLAQATHVVAITSPDEIDDELRTLLHTAYEQNP